MINQRRSTYPNREPVQTTGATSNIDLEELVVDKVECSADYVSDPSAVEVMRGLVIGAVLGGLIWALAGFAILELV